MLEHNSERWARLAPSWAFARTLWRHLSMITPGAGAPSWPPASIYALSLDIITRVWWREVGSRMARAKARAARTEERMGNQTTTAGEDVGGDAASKELEALLTAGSETASRADFAESNRWCVIGKLVALTNDGTTAL